MYRNKNESLQYRALVSDFDNTLVGSDKKINVEVSNAVKELLQAGFIFALATGRAYAGYIRQASQDLALQHPIITRGGAEIIDPTTHTYLYQKYMQPQIAQQVTARLLEAEVPFIVEAGDTAYFSEHFDRDRIKEFAHIAPIRDCDFSTPIAKLYVASEHTEPQMDALCRTIETAFPHDISVQKILSKSLFGLDVTAGGVNKHSALLVWMQHMDLSPKEVVGIGDGYNDFALLAACGLKVAVENAHNELKELADIIAASQENNGIIGIIDAYFLNNGRPHKT